MTDIETISICDVDYTDRPSEHEDVEVENIQSNPASWAPASEKNFGGISTVLGGLFGE